MNKRLLQLLLSGPAKTKTLDAIEHLDISQLLDLGNAMYPSSDKEIKTLLFLTTDIRSDRSLSEEAESTSMSHGASRLLYTRLSLSAAKQDWVLKILLDMGYNVNGGILDRVTRTPFDQAR